MGKTGVVDVFNEAFPRTGSFSEDKGGVSNPEVCLGRSDTQSCDVVSGALICSPAIVSDERLPVVSPAPHVFSAYSCIPSHNDHDASVKLSVVDRSSRASIISCSL